MGVDEAERDIRGPEVLAAELALDRLKGPAAAAVPLNAAWWIVEGHDGIELARLAGLPGDDTFEVRDALREALEAMGVGIPSSEEAVTILFDDLAQRCLDGRTSERSIAIDVWEIYVASDYADAIARQPLGRILGVADEWEGGWGRLEDELATEVRSACREQLRSRAR